MNKIELLTVIDNLIDKTHCVYYKGETYNFFDSGLTRRVFVNEEGTKVIKLLINEFEGINHNQIEYDIYSSSENKDKLAKTEISSDGNIVEQEFVLPIKFSDKELSLEEIQFAMKCRNEVGWNSIGNLVCFDLDELNKY